MTNDIQSIVVMAKEAFTKCQTQNELLQEKANFLGKKGPISQIMATMRELSIEEKKEYINELNVFPVPDGDTGTNMTLTITAAAKEVANIKSAKKRIEVNRKKNSNNVPKKSSMKTAIKKAVTSPSEESIKEAFKRIDKALAKNIITKNKAARAKSRVSNKLNENK